MLNAHLARGARLAWRALLFAGLLLPASLYAQVGSATDIITGTVTRTEGGLPIEGANVEVTSLESNVTRRARTNDKGRYTVLFPDGGGQYRIVIRALGLAPTTLNVGRQADEDRLIADAKLSTNPTVLAGVTVRATQNVAPQGDRPTPGSVERALTTDQAARLPIDASDLTELALVAPGVVSITGSDSTAAGFSVAGQSPDANNITLDGLSFGASSVPQEAVRSSRVITSGYDVSRGQFSGGQVSSTTRGGTNNVQGNFSYSLRDRELSVDGDDPSPAAQGFTQNQFSGGFGGPIVKDHVFIFGALQLRRRDDIVPSLGNADASTLSRFGVSPDSVERFFALANAQGISPLSVRADDRTSDNISGIVRLDYLTPGGQSISVRGDYRWSGQDPTRIGPLALPQTGGDSRNWGGGIAATVTSNFGGRFLNEFKTYLSTDKRNGTPFLTTPTGRVQVASSLEGGTSGISTLSFGGNTGLPQEGTTNALETTNELSWLSEGGAHRFKLGGLLSLSSFEQDVTSNRWGTYMFNSLADFENDVPASFTRTLAPRLRAGQGLNAAVYLGDTWRVNRALQLTYGVRGEQSRFGKTPAYNPAVQEAFGFRTDEVPTELRFSPRVGFTWSLGMPEQGRFAPPRWVLRGGVGEFRSRPSTSLVAAASGATGLADTESQLVCIGSDVPTPDWGLFGSDPANIPTECLGGGNGFIPTSLPNVTVFGKDFSAPRAWRSSLGIQRRFLERFNLRVDLSYARGMAQTGYRDANLLAEPRFSLGAEGNRPVFVDPSTIIPTTGATSVLGSRMNPEFGQVLVTGSDRESESKQMTVSLGGVTSKGAVLNLSYTYGNARDQGSGGGLGSATTAGNPNVREWSPSGFDRRHTMVATVTYPFSQAMELTAFARGSSGSPFTPLVNADINGDGARNDRAFLFDPLSAADPAVAAGMQRLLSTSPSSVKECFAKSLGAVAGRNSCRGPWQPSLDLQFNWRPGFFGLNRRLSISVLTVNALGGLDQLLHGSDDLRGWGQFQSPDNTLLYVRGFDAATNAYKYEVNERFGASRNGANGIRIPFQLGLQARYTLGPDRFRDMIRGMIGGGGGGQRGGPGGGAVGGPNGGPGGGPGMAMGGMNANPVNTLITTLKDSVGLSEEQVAKLKPLSDSIAAKNAALNAEFQKLLKDAGANPDMGALFGKMRPKMEAMQKERQAALKVVQEALTAEQWAKVPERIKNPQQGRGGRGES